MNFLDRGKAGLPRQGQGWTSQTGGGMDFPDISLGGGLSILEACSPGSFVHRPRLPGKRSCRYG